MNDIHLLEEKTGFNFRNKDILQEALTHRSYLNENPSWHLPHNERLEYLGDAVLELIVTEALYVKYPESPEGQLTVIRAALVNYQILGRIADELSLGDYIFMSRGERGDSSKAREVILANTFEALVGAMYVDQGLDSVRPFVERFVLSKTEEIVRNRSYKDAKSELQEVVQDRFRVTPSYEVLEESGPAHDKTFRVGVFYAGEKHGEGAGKSKQEAEVEAAKFALEEYRD